MNDTTQSLNILLPTLNGNLPRELLDLSQSLLAQSRIRAPNLKAKEEIARPYTCAEIACKRLSVRLRLPRPAERPPCEKTVYKKLLALLEHVLFPMANQTPKKDTTKSSVVKEVKSPKTPTPARNGKRLGGAEADTPSKKRAFAGKIGNGRATKGPNQEAPVFVMPLIRQLCAASSAKALAPHVYTGVCTILRLAEVETASEDVHEEISTLAIVVFFLALAKGSEMDPETYVKQSESALSIAGLDANMRDRLDEWVERISENDWSHGQEWWQNIPESALPEDTGMADDTDEVDEDMVLSLRKRRRATSADDKKDGVLLPGLGTMLQEHNDWLSDEKQLDFEKWKNGVLRRIKQLEKGQRNAVLAS